jgi:methyl-accepting chemotaxis protein
MNNLPVAYKISLAFGVALALATIIAIGCVASLSRLHDTSQHMVATLLNGGASSEVLHDAMTSQALYASTRSYVGVLVVITLLLAVVSTLAISRSLFECLGAFTHRLRDIDASFSDLADGLEAAGGGDLRQRGVRQTDFLQWSRKDEIGKLADVFDHMLTNVKASAKGASAARMSLSQLIDRLRASAEVISKAANQISTANQDLAGRTSAQAGSVEETAAAIEQMAGAVKQSADTLRAIKGFAASNLAMASNGVEISKAAMTTMGGIEASSKGIIDAVAVIDELAFQTNILALNAAVEAARVGGEGRGFAVVAAEVQILARRSSEAAQQIKTLVGGTSEKVEIGNVLVNKNGEQLVAIESNVTMAVSVLAGMSAAADEQSDGVAQVNLAIQQMDSITQQNSRLVDESTSISNAMSEQANALHELVLRFKIDEENRSVNDSEETSQETPALATGTYA